MSDYFISDKKDLLNTAKIHALLKECFWCKDIPIEYVERFIKHSLCFGAYKKQNNELIGFARVITDSTTYAYVCDVVIDPNYRRQGIAKAMFKAIREYPELQGLKTWSLRSTVEARDIYVASGFKVACEPQTILEIDDVNFYIKK